MTITRVLPVLFAACGLLLAASPAQAVWFAADNVDGPSPGIVDLGGADLSRDGSGGLVYLKKEGGVNHVFVSQFFEGVFFPAQRVDAGQGTASSQPRIGAGEDGRLVVVWVNAGSLWGVAQNDKNGQFSQPTRIYEGSAAGPVADPALSVNVAGVGYVAFTAPGGGRDVRAARIGISSQGWTVINGVFDIDPPRDAGTGAGRPSVAVSADGSALVGWGESGGALVRRAGRTNVSNTPIAVSDSDLGGAAPGAADSIDVAVQDDSSYGWAAIRQTFSGDGGAASRLIARRLVGSNFEGPFPIDGLDFPAPEGASAPHLAVDGRGRGLASGSRDASRTPIAALGRENGFGGGQLMSQLTNGGTAPDAEVAVGEALDGVVAWKEAPPAAPAGTVVKARFESDNSFGDEFQVSRDDFGPTGTAEGFAVSADGQANTIVAFVQGGPDSRRIVAGIYDKPPGRARLSTPRKVRTQEPRFKWGAATEQFGAPTYTVVLDGDVIGETKGLSFPAPRPLSQGKHRWRVDATDSRGQLRRGNYRELTIEPPAAGARR